MPNVGKTQIGRTKMKANVGKRRSVGTGSGGFARVVPLEDYVKLEQLMKPLAVPPTLKTNQSQVRSFLMKVLSNVTFLNSSQFPGPWHLAWQEIFLL